ncbi:MAG: hypothetical protein KDC66_17265 [Phaeodactylibacter sp.]|nr:hypothetical protein [Phaeodactylibacter sp.]MCB9274114.1 hypothetical protein [Lewinellaceae bacterium]
MKKNTLFTAILFLPLLLAAQSYNTALGIRLGTDWGFTVQQRVGKLTTVEGIVQASRQREEAMVSLLGEQHFPLISRRLNIYAGGGPHFGWLNETIGDSGEKYKNPFGITAIAGAELSLGRFNLSYDFKPAINISGGQHTFYPQTGISLRYVIVKRPWLNGDNKNKRQRQRERERRRRQKDKDGFNWRFWE